MVVRPCWQCRARERAREARADAMAAGRLAYTEAVMGLELEQIRSKQVRLARDCCEQLAR